MQVGLKVKNAKKLEQVVGYTMCSPRYHADPSAGAGAGAFRGSDGHADTSGGHMWFYSDRVLQLIADYRARFPALFALLEQRAQRLAESEHRPGAPSMFSLSLEDLIPFIDQLNAPGASGDAATGIEKSLKGVISC